jgi:DNA-binding NarL/FixJ family response regulator
MERAATGMETVRVVVADDFDAMRRLVRLQLEDPEAGAPVRVVGEADSTNGLADLVERERPDVLLLDLHISGRMESCDLVPALRAASPRTAILLYSGLPGDLLRDEADAMGADGHIPKEWEAGRVRSAVVAAARYSRWRD